MTNYPAGTSHTIPMPSYPMGTQSNCPNCPVTQRRSGNPITLVRLPRVNPVTLSLRLVNQLESTITLSPFPNYPAGIHNHTIPNYPAGTWEDIVKVTVCLYREHFLIYIDPDHFRQIEKNSQYVTSYLALFILPDI